MKIDFLKGPSVSISASPEDWGLYNADTPEYEQERDFTAEDLNRGLEQIIAMSPTVKEIPWTEIDQLLQTHSYWGAADTEGYYAVERILKTVYGEEK